MKNRKRLMSVLLTAVMLLTLIPVLSLTAFAETYTSTGNIPIINLVAQGDIFFQGSAIHNSTNYSWSYRVGGSTTPIPKGDTIPIIGNYRVTQVQGNFKRIIFEPITVVNSISLNPNSEQQINVGGTTTLTAQLSPNNAYDKTVTWTSSDNKIATVTNGTVTGVAPGQVTITASANGGDNKTATCIVTVNALTMTVTAPADVTKTYDGSAATITDPTVTVPDSGYTIQYSTNGTDFSDTKPTLKDAGETTVTYKITATNYETKTVSNKVTISPANMTASVEQNGTLKYNGSAQTPQVTTTYTTVGNAEPTFKYSLERDGNYTENVPGITNAGETTVYFKAEEDNHNGAAGTFTVTMAKGDIQYNVTEVNVPYDGQTHSITVNVTSPASGYTIGYNLDSNEGYFPLNPAPASINNNGHVVYYQITADNYNAVQGSALVKITGTPVTLVDIVPDSIQLYKPSVGDPLTVQVNVGPENATCKDLKWRSDNEGVVSVDANGTLTANGIGTTIVYAHSVENDNMSDYVTVTVSDPAAPQLTNVTGASGDAHIWRQKSNKDVVLTFKDRSTNESSYEAFVAAGRKVWFDGRQLTEGEFSAEKGSTVITLKASLLQGSSIGAHEVKVDFNYGNTLQVAVPITIKTPASTSPDTADHRNQGLWYAILGLSVVGVASLVTLEKKRRVSGK